MNPLLSLLPSQGRNAKLGLTGRKSGDVGILTTSKLYRIQNKLFAFMPQRFDVSREGSEALHKRTKSA